MEQHIVKRDNSPDLKFFGELIAKTSSSDNRAAASNYSGSAGRWAVLKLYRTEGGKFICEQIGRTSWTGEHDRHSGAVCDDLAGVASFFGHGWLAKDLYAEAEIDTAVDADLIPVRKAYCYETKFSDGRPNFWSVIAASNEQDAHDAIIAELQGIDLLNFGCDERPDIAELHLLASDAATLAEDMLRP